jgi:hypothetical protein
MIHRDCIITGCGYESPRPSFRVILQGWPNKFRHILAVSPFVNVNKTVKNKVIPVTGRESP